ncbi:MAG: FoF1 ATP synthase subunit a, partial [Oscillospiraceae bacterium]
MEINILGPKIIFKIGPIEVTQTVINSWIIIIGVFFLCLFLTHKLEKVPRKRRQQLVEKAITMLDKLVEETMGKRNMKFAPYILTILVFSAFGSLISLLGLRSVTADLNTTLAWGLITFVMIWVSGFKAHGMGQLHGLIEPVFIMFPLNVLSEVATPFSMAFRHFGNILSGMIVSTLIYAGLAGLTTALFNIAIPF